MGIKGQLDRVTDQGLWGWAMDTSSSDPLEIQLFVDNELLITTPANRYRADVHGQKLHPTGNCGFAVNFAAVQKAYSGERSFRAFAICDSQAIELANSPFSIYLAAPPVEYDEYGLAIPPDFLRKKVINTAKVEQFLSAQKRNIFQRVSIELEQCDLPPIPSMEKILDFGCGSGRLVRAFPRQNHAQIYGCDIDGEAIKWCSQNLPFASFLHATEYPPLAYPDNFFDFIFAVSVFTHLDESHQFQWLAELKRITQKGGVLLLTFKDEAYLQQVETGPDQANLLAALKKSKGIHFQTTEFWKDSFPAYYQDTLHSRAYIEEVWSSYFRLEKIVPPGQLFSQSVAIMVKE